MLNTWQRHPGEAIAVRTPQEVEQVWDVLRVHAIFNVN